ncbi:STAS domain-containing protein [Desulfovibrio subterraneus]|jgi:anti-anti-sigma factor|uniref:Anti-sigma factor antagonist n=1 Tax=Desulfovibrio subterraneus TaxID=2718620 RepID=A0A7J0BKQ5_9BACT|nr:STAS domain-containing protein [Desulfovibrio subterraneus]GFM33782.1 anti-sigma factor antagonist [Desulfovibrio subterraneus]
MDSLNPIQQGTTLLIQFKGEVTLNTAPDLRTKIESFVERERIEHLVADMQEVTFIDSSGVGMLVALKTKMASKSKSLFILNPSAQVRSTLGLVHLSNFFQILEGDEGILDILPE